MAKPNQTRPDPNQQPDHREEQPEYIPASPVKRTMAWIGVVYMVILVAMMTYYYFTGSMLVNMAPLLTVPGLIGLGALILVSWHSTGHPRRGLAFGLSLLCFCLAAFTLPIGLLGLMSNF